MYNGPIIDCDVHHARATDEELLPYLSRGWRDYIANRGPAGIMPLTVQDGLPNPHGFMRADTFPPDGGPPGSDYETLRRQVLERGDIRRAILTFGDDSHLAGHHNPYFATELARALNDWSIDRWLSQDSRLASSIMVATQLPEEAAKEIYRHADNARMVQVMLVDNPHHYPFGHPLFHPVYAAAEETGRPIAIHGGAGGWANPASTAGGSINLYFEAHTLWPQVIMTHLVSFVSHGVFEKFPRLRLLLIEAGAAWLPSLLWRFDTEYKGLRREVPWLRKLPSEYVQEHVWLTTQPLEISPRQEQVTELLGWVNGKERLCYSSDYPHWDADESGYIAARLPESWHRGIFFENALNFYGWREADLALPERAAVPA